jgi:NADPH-dependent 2,4-dienoyl-CoA reductase/sulfur reductase-like enzyme/nitrite reductase/ring-hydroxylating ferredoxin subunit
MSESTYDVAGAGDLEDGQMRAVKAGETELLLVRTGGEYYALAAHCTHYGAPLADGVLSGTRIVCPWHHACFDATSGDLLEPPAFDALSRFDVRVEAGRVVVTVPAEPADRRVPEMVAPDPVADTRVFAILGAGAAGYAAAQALREDGFRGRIVMVTREGRLPYDRPNLSKDYLNGHAEPAWMPLRPDEFYAEHGIEVARGRGVVRFDAATRTVTFDDGERATYDAVLVATGSTARRLQVPGADLDGVFTLRGFDDSDAIVAAAEGASRAVVVGASFIGMEVAAALVERGLSVTVVAPDAVPFASTLGEEVGRMLRALHEEHGVAFRLETGVARIEGERSVGGVTLEDGSRLEADLVVAGIGARPATGFVEGLDLEDDGGILVDERLRAAEGVWAAGDVAWFPDPRAGGRARIEHWRTALQQGRVAAHDMAGRGAPLTAVPFFWTNQYGEGVQYVGHARHWDEVLVDGDVAARDFLALYLENGVVLAASASGRDRQVGALSELMRLDRMPSADEVRNGQFDWEARLREL